MMSVAIQPGPFICLLDVVNHAHSPEHTMYFTAVCLHSQCCSYIITSGVLTFIFCGNFCSIILTSSQLQKRKTSVIEPIQ